jgi:hypothetical protein
VVAPFAEDLDSLEDIFVRRYEGAATSRGEQLAASKAEHTDVSPRSSRPPLYDGTRDLASIFHNADTSLGSQRAELPHIRTATVQMGNYDCSCGHAHCVFDSFGGHAPGVWIDVDQHGEGTHGLDATKIATKIVAC